MPKYYQLIIYDWDGTLADSQAQIINRTHDEKHFHQYQPDYLNHNITEIQNLVSRNPHV